MCFQEADEFNATHGNQFISDLMPKTPIYTAMLPESARAVMGVPHPSGRAAMKMLEREGFKYDHYIDLFDGGPTVSVETDQIRTIRESNEYSILEERRVGKACVRTCSSRWSPSHYKQNKQKNKNTNYTSP